MTEQTSFTCRAELERAVTEFITTVTACINEADKMMKSISPDDGAPSIASRRMEMARRYLAKGNNLMKLLSKDPESRHDDSTPVRVTVDELDKSFRWLRCMFDAEAGVSQHHVAALTRVG